MLPLTAVARHRQGPKGGMIYSHASEVDLRSSHLITERDATFVQLCGMGYSNYVADQKEVRDSEALVTLLTCTCPYVITWLVYSGNSNGEVSQRRGDRFCW